MTTRSEREKAEKLNQHHQAVLEQLLKEEDNRLCADCKAKGPRWASWTLGVFMCIRCAGIHRNLGVHISRVKSVNLDQWTSEQIQGMVEMGNGRARAVYEAELPENFRRPESDQAVEVFIRDKYDRKRFFNKDALPVKSAEAPESPSQNQDKAKAEKEKKKEEKKSEKNSSKVNSRSPKKSPDKLKEPKVPPEEKEQDLLGPEVSDPAPSAQAAAETAPPPGAAAKPEEQKPKKKLMSKDSILSLYNCSGGGFGQQQIPNGAMATAQGGATTTAQGGATAGVNQVSEQVSSLSVMDSSSTAPPSGQTLSTQLWK